MPWLFRRLTMKTQEIITGLRKLSQQGSQYRRTVCRLAADKLEQMQAEFKTIQEDGLCAVCTFDDIAPPGCENDCCFSWRGKEEPEDSKVVEIDQFNHWISVTERLPELGVRVLASDGGFVGEFYLSDRGQWKRYNVNNHSLLMALDILYWMPMPEPPKEVANGSDT